jgi:predicted GIY-YIG superfamily endonuclease
MRDFCIKHIGAYASSKKNGWFKDICSHLIKKPLSDDDIINQAKKYNSRTELINKNINLHLIAKRRNLWEKCCSHMKRIGNLMNRAIYSIEFYDNSVYVGLTLNYEKRLNAHIKKGKFKNKMRTVKYKFIEHGIFYDIDTAPKKEAELIETYRSKGWSILNTKQAGALGPVQTKDLDKLKIEITNIANKYKYIGDFKKHDTSAYSLACKHGFLKDISSRMIHKKIKKYSENDLKNIISKYVYVRDLPQSICTAARNLGIYKELTSGLISFKPKTRSKEEILRLAKKFKYRVDFLNKYPSAVGSARRNGWLEEACEHMEYKGSWKNKNLIK